MTGSTGQASNSRPLNQLDKLEKQNRNLAINVFGRENDCVVVHRLSKKEARVPWQNLLLLVLGIFGS